MVPVANERNNVCVCVCVCSHQRARGGGGEARASIWACMFVLVKMCKCARVSVRTRARACAANMDVCTREKTCPNLRVRTRARERVCACARAHLCVCARACHYVGSCVCFRVCTQGRALKKRSLGAVLLGLGLAPGTAPCWAAAARHEEGGLVATGLLVRGWPQKGTERGASGAAGAQLVLLDTLFPVAPLPPSHLQPSLPPCAVPTRAPSPR